MNLTWLFPYRAHLEAEIDYLRAQLAQKQRRIDALQESLIEISKPAPRVYLSKDDPKIQVRVQPKGWDAVRADRKANPEPKEEPDGVSSK